MNTHTDEKRYLSELTAALRLRHISGVRIGEILAEVEAHTAESGQSAREAFGTPKDYARQFEPSATEPGRRQWGRQAWTGTLTAAIGAWLFAAGAFAGMAGENFIRLPGWYACAIGAVILSDKVAEPFLSEGSMYTHGITFGGHPVQCAVALKNIEIMKREGIVEHVRETEDVFRQKLETLLDLPIVGDVRGTGFFYAIELVKDRETRATFDEDECETLLRGFLSGALFDAGLICRADDRGDPVVQISPPLVATEREIDELVGILGDVLAEAGRRMR